MFKKILQLMGFDYLLLRKEVLTLQARNKALELEVTKRRPVIGVEVGDPAPADRVQRKMYIARVAQFYQETMKSKLMSMIAEVRAELEKVDNTGKMDDILKGTINGLWLIDDWGTQAVNEHVADVQGDADLSEEERKLLEDKTKQ